MTDEERGYRITKWKTFDNFECIHCQYSTLWKDKIEKHLAESPHAWAYPVPEEDKLKLSQSLETELDY